MPGFALRWPDALRPGLRLKRWWLARTPPTEIWTLTQRNVYIVPTRAGLAFGLTLLVLLVMSINYQLNLGYALTFLLTGSALASMHMTHSSLRGLQLHLKQPAPVFCGESAQLEVILTNPGAVRHGLGLSLETLEHGAYDPTWAQGDAKSQSTVVVSFASTRRGRQPLPMLRLQSTFPFGLFRAWTVWRPAGGLWVYPRPEQPCPALPESSAVDGSGAQKRQAQGGEFDGVRPWRRGDSLRQIAWKKVARSGELVSRDTQTTARQQLWLHWEHTHLSEPEARLSRLAAWVLACYAQNQPFGLRLPGRELACDEGLAQRQAALQTLAEWRQPV